MPEPTGSAYETDEQGPYFFLSYAHTPKIDPDGPDPNHLVVKLFNDISTEVMNLVPGNLPPGFMDQALRAGNHWPRRVTEALATCRVFLALYSPRYFANENCGKEWFAFHRRQVDHVAAGLRNPEAIIPLLWVPIDESILPQATRSIHFSHALFGELYARSGFSQLININRYSDDYRIAVRQLAEHIVHVADTVSVEPCEPSELVDLDCAFGTDERKRSNNWRLQVIVVADDYYHLPSSPEKRSMDYYGVDSVRWNPYRPESAIPLADYAANLARGLGFAPEIVWFDHYYQTLLDPASMDGPAVLLVDPWATLNPERHERLRAFDQLAKPWVQVIVPWSAADAQTAANDGVLRHSMGDALGTRTNQAQLPGRHPLMGLPSLHQFGNALPAAINDAVRNHLRNSAPNAPDGHKSPRWRLRDLTPRERRESREHGTETTDGQTPGGAT